MRFNKSILLFLIFIVQSNLMPQEDSSANSFCARHLLTLSSGAGFYSVRDEMMSPIIYRGTKIPFVFTYRYSGLLNRHSLLLHYNSGDLTSSITNPSSGSHFIRNLNLDLEYSWAMKIKELNEYNTNCWLGARFLSMLNLREQYFYRENSHTSAEQMTGLGIYLMTETYFQGRTDNFLTVEINIPFVSYALLTDRFNANVSESFAELNYEESVFWQAFKKGKVITFNKLFEIQADVAYNIFFTERIGIGLRYRFQYYSFEQYPSLFRSKVLLNQFLIGVMVKL